MIMSKRLLAAGVVAALALAACGDDDDDEAAPSATTEAPAAAATTAAPATTAAAPGTTAAGGGGGDGSDVTVGLTFDLLGRGDQSFNDSAAAGMDRAKADFGVTVNELTPTDASARGTDLQLQAENSDLVIGVGFSFATDAKTIAAENPDVHVRDRRRRDVERDLRWPGGTQRGRPRVLRGAGLVPRRRRRRTEEHDRSDRFHRWREWHRWPASRSSRPATSPVPRLSTLTSRSSSQVHQRVSRLHRLQLPDSAQDIANAMYAGGADIVYAAAGRCRCRRVRGRGKTTSDSTGTKVWAIGVDSDQYNTVDPAVKDFILTSMIKHVDVAVYEAIKAQMDGKVVEPDRPATTSRPSGVDYATSGGFVDDIKDKLEAYKADIISGKIVVPTDPTKA